jgi:coenzyme F420-reducing hydrogenase alpha subunit
VRECRRLLGAFKVGGGLYFRLRGRAGEGLALTEAPRGLLMHRYVLNQKGLVEEAEVVTPTAHNVAALEAALKALLSRHARAGRQGLLRLSGMLVRAFDPCFSCSVH